MDKEWFKKLITSKNIRKELENEENLKILLKIMPELKDMIGFEHKHPHHHLDVWNHTILAMENSDSNYEIRLALLLHDIGKPHSYQDEEVRHFRNHANESEIISKNILEKLGENPDFINEILFLIKNHDSLIVLKDVEDKELDKYLKLLKMQYCDARAHHPDKVENRIEKLNKIKDEIYIRIKSINLNPELKPDIR